MTMPVHGEKLPESAAGELLASNKKTVACAESCTGGLLTSRLTDVPGSSAYVKGAVVSYTDEVKAEVLGVRRETLAAVGAVSKETAAEMAEGARKKLGADYALSITGNAGPGISEEKPLGLVYIGLASADETVVHEFRFTGTRHEIKEAAADEALYMLCRALKKG